MKSGGVVSDARTELDTQRLAKYIGGKHALVAQGGGQRGILLLVYWTLFYYLILTLTMSFMALQQVP